MLYGGIRSMMPNRTVDPMPVISAAQWCYQVGPACAGSSDAAAAAVGD